MNLYFDTEFTGLHKDTTLISIGIVSDNDEEFYAEITDYDKSQVDNWIKENVISNLKLSKGDHIRYNPKYHTSIDGHRIMNSYSLQMSDKKEIVAQELKKWLLQFNPSQFVSDVCHYDFTLLIDLFGSAFDLPDNISPYCYDINQDIAKYKNITCKEAFDINREKLSDINLNDSSICKHNALWDAKIIKNIYNKINK